MKYIKLREKLFSLVYFMELSGQNNQDTPIEKPDATKEKMKAPVSERTETILSMLHSQNTIKKTLTRVYLLRHYPYDTSTEEKKKITEKYEECLKRRRELIGTEEEKKNNERILELGKQVSIFQEFKSLDPETQDIYRAILANP